MINFSKDKGKMNDKTTTYAYDELGKFEECPVLTVFRNDT